MLRRDPYDRGPKRTIRAGLREAGGGDTVVIREGRYAEDLDVAGRRISVRFAGNVDIHGPVGLRGRQSSEDTETGPPLPIPGSTVGTPSGGTNDVDSVP